MIELTSLNIEALNYKVNGHYKLVRKLQEDSAVQRYISSRFSSWVKEPESTSNFEIGKSYVIKDKEKIVGMCGTTKIDRDGVVDLWAAIEKEYRKLGYGEKIALEMAMYFIENIKDISDVKLIIDKTNPRANKNAVHSGYVLFKSYDNYNEYRYFG